MTIEELLKREDLIGGDMWNVVGDYFFRGPIQSIAPDADGFVVITRVWTAWSPPRKDLAGRWEIYRNPEPVKFNPAKSYIYQMGNGKVRVRIFGDGFADLAPKGLDDLDPFPD